MNDNGETIDWRKLREFADVDLERSFILSWDFEAGTLQIDVDLLLLPDPPSYEPPRPAEKVCIRPALIEFPYCVAVELPEGGSGGDIATSIAGLEGGAIRGLRKIADVYYELQGEFGDVLIEAERPLLRLKAHHNGIC